MSEPTVPAEWCEKLDITAEQLPIISDLAHMLVSVENNYRREGAFPGSRFAGPTPETCTLEWWLAVCRDVSPMPLRKQRSRDPCDDPYLSCALAAPSVLELSDALPITNRRYGRLQIRLQICATRSRCALNKCSPQD